MRGREARERKRWAEEYGEVGRGRGREGEVGKERER